MRIVIEPDQGDLEALPGLAVVFAAKQQLRLGQAIFAHGLPGRDVEAACIGWSNPEPARRILSRYGHADRRPSARRIDRALNFEAARAGGSIADAGQQEEAAAVGRFNLEIVYDR